MNRSARHFYDIIIAGAGPAGLLIGSKLAGDLRVLILDRGTIGNTTKFWLTSNQRLQRHGLEGAVAYRTDRGSIASFLGGYALAIGDYAVVDDRILLMTLSRRCQERGAELVDNSAVQCIRWGHASITVETTLGSFQCRLLIDATGGNSPIATTFRSQKLDGFYSIYGAHLRGIRLKTEEIIGSHVIRLGYPVPMFEVFPTGDSSAFAVVFFATRRLQKVSEMKSAFHDHLVSNPFFEITRKTEEFEGKMGGIPIGRPRPRRLPGIFAFGEAGMIQSPLIGGAFNEVLKHVDDVADAVRKEFQKRSTGIVNVGSPRQFNKLYNDRLQAVAVRHLLSGTLEEYERLVYLLERLGPELTYRLFCSDLKPGDFPAVARAYSLSRWWRFKAKRGVP